MSPLAPDLSSWDGRPLGLCEEVRTFIYLKIHVRLADLLLIDNRSANRIVNWQPSGGLYYYRMHGFQGPHERWLHLRVPWTHIRQGEGHSDNIFREDPKLRQRDIRIIVLSLNSSYIILNPNSFTLLYIH